MRSTFAPTDRSVVALLGRTLTRHLLVAAVLLLALAPLGTARAQNGAGCPISAPVTITTSTYTLTNNNECQALVFTSISPVTVTAPSAATVAPGFQVMLLPIYNGLTVTSLSGGSLIGRSTMQLIGAGQSGVLIGDGSNYFWAGGSGFGAVAAAVSGVATAGTNWSNSPVVMLPNGVLQITNQASIVPANSGDAFAVCRGGAVMGLGPAGEATNAQRGAPSWWQILDPLSRSWKIPLC